MKDFESDADNGLSSSDKPIDGIGLTRQEFLHLVGGLGAASCLAGGTWAALEALVSPDLADSWKKSVCRFCGVGCGILAGMREGRLAAIRGDEEAHNKGVICIKGSLLTELPNLQGRLTRPKIKHKGRFVDATWEEAMSLIAENFQASIKAYGPNSVAFYGSGQLYTEESYTANKLFKAGIRTNNVDGNPRLCMASAAVGYVQVYGKDEPPGSYEDIDHGECFFLIGSNAYECHPALFERIQARRKSRVGTQIICVDPRRTRTAELSDIHLQIVPGTDLLLLNAIANVICEDNLRDEKFIAQHVRFDDGREPVDYEEFERFLRNYSPEDVAGSVGVSANDIRKVAHLFAESAGTVSLWTMGINQRVQGVFLNNALNGLHLITGQICKPGATPLSLTGQCNACGGVRDTGALAHLLPAGRLITKETDRNEIEDLWGIPRGTISSDPGLDAIHMFRAMEDGRLKAALVMCSNPAQSLPSLQRYREGMENCFLAVADAFEDTETCQLADVLLPAALWIEKTGVYGQTDRRYQLIEKLIDPPGEARSDLAVLVDLAERLGHGSLIRARSPQAVWDEWRKVSASSPYNFEGITYKRLRQKRGIQWPCPSEKHPGTVRRYVGGDDPNVSAGQSIEFYGRPDKRAVVYLRAYKPSPEETDTEFPLLLTTGRVLEQWHTGTMTDRIVELQKASGRAQFELSPQDARSLGVANGDRVEVRSRFGTQSGRAVVTDRSRRGVLFASFYDSRFLLNRVVSDHMDPISKQPEFKITAVAVRRI